MGHNCDVVIIILWCAFVVTCYAVFAKATGKLILLSLLNPIQAEVLGITLRVVGD